MKRLLMLLLVASAPAFADCPEPSEELKEQMRWCEAHLGCVPTAKITENCSDVMSRIRDFFSSHKREIESPEYGEGDADREARERAANRPATPLVDRRTAAQIRADEERDRKRRAEMDAINAIRIPYRNCEFKPFGGDCTADIALYRERQQRVDAFRKEHGYWKAIEDLRLHALDQAIELREQQERNAARVLPRAAAASPDLVAVVGAIGRYDRYDAARPQRVADEAAAAARQKAIDEENNRKFQAELAQRKAESRQELSESLQALAGAVDAYAKSKGDNAAGTDCEAIKEQGREATLDAGCDWGGTVR